MALRGFRALQGAGMIVGFASLVIAGCGGGDAFTTGAAGAGGAAAGAGGGSATGGAAGTGGASAGGTSAGGTGGSATAGSAGAGATGGSSVGKGGSAGSTAGKGGSSGAGAAGGSAGAGGSSGAGAGGTTGGSAGSSGGGTGGGGAGGCDATEMPAAGAIHVSTMGVDATADGSAGKPFKTIQKALAAQKAASGAPPIVVAPGTYDQPVDVSPATSGATVTIDGAWTTTFTRDCSATAGAGTIITATMGAPLSVMTVAGVAVKLHAVTVKTRPQADVPNHDQPGVSLFGIMVAASGDVTLDHVGVVTGKASKGGPSSNAKGGAPPTCTGLDDCSTGTDGALGGVGAAAMKGTFTDMGYVPGDGTKGTPGQPGKNGMAGQMGDNGPCVGCSGAMGSCLASTDLKTAGMGLCGCGANPGDPAQPGHGGGAAVGVYVTTGAKLAVVASTITTAAGGDGSAPSDPGLAGDPTDGTAGANASCEENNGGAAMCAWSAAQMKCIPVNVTEVQLSGGNAGGKGGKAGNGGTSGGGSGGPSVAIVHSAAATVTVDGMSMLTPGTGGIGAGMAPSGVSAAQAAY